MNLSRELETPRLRLRPFALRDAEPMYALLRDPVVNTFLPWFCLLYTSDAADD